MPEQHPTGGVVAQRIELTEAEVRDVPVADIGHPLVDRVGTAPDGTAWTATETRSRVVHLSALRLNFLATALRDGRSPVLISDELTRLTPSFTRVWRAAGGRWVVREPSGGLRDGDDGRRLDTIDDVLTAEPPRSVDDIAVNYLRPVAAESLQVSAMIAVRHPARTGTVLGAAAESLTQAVFGLNPRVWGAHEPAGQPWDRQALTALIREHMPAEKTVFATGPGLDVSISAQRTEHGVEEIVYATLSLGQPDDDELNRLRIELSAVLQRLAETSMPLAGLLLARPGPADLLVPPFLTAPPIPLAVLIGAPAVRGFGLDVAELSRRFGARPVGRPRIPAVLVDLGAIEPTAWNRLDAVLRVFDPEQLATALGRGQEGLWTAQVDRPNAAPLDPPSAAEADRTDTERNGQGHAEP